MTNPEQNEGSLASVGKSIEKSGRNIGYLEAINDIYEWAQTTEMPSETKVALLERLEYLLAQRRKDK